MLQVFQWLIELLYGQVSPRRLIACSIDSIVASWMSRGDQLKVQFLVEGAIYSISKTTLIVEYLIGDSSYSLL